MKSIRTKDDNAEAAAAIKNGPACVILSVRVESATLSALLEKASPEDRQKILDETQSYVDRRTMVMTADQLATMLQMNRSQIFELTKERTRHGLMREHPIPAKKIGGSLRFLRGDIVDWLQKLG
jgi:predicted DNA-binding transcriptional regulator AlpA